MKDRLQQANAYYVETKDLSVGYNGKPLIEHIGFHVRQGEILTLIGPNGSGKSTILKSIVGQLKMIAGTIFLDGKQLQDRSQNDIAKRMAILMTERLQPELMTCRDIVSTGRYPYTGRLGLLSPEDKAIVQEALIQVDGLAIAERPFTDISDGQRQRILLARALCQQPEVIILDEPTSFLDIRYKLELLSILKKMVREKNLAVIVSLHELDLAERISDTVVCVSGDRIDRIGSPKEIFTADYIASLYHMEPDRYDSCFDTLEYVPRRQDALAATDDNVPRRQDALADMDDNVPRRQDAQTDTDEYESRREDAPTDMDDNAPRSEDTLTDTDDAAIDNLPQEEIAEGSPKKE